MKNLTEFKSRLKSALENGQTINVERNFKTTFDKSDPRFNIYPNGTLMERNVYPSCKIGRVQTNAFTRIINEGKNAGKESWTSFGKASEWSFPDENTAVWSNHENAGFAIFETTLTFTFN